MIIGLTGGIGSGKSTIAHEFAQRGYTVYDCDQEAKRIIAENPDVQQEIIDLLGEEAFIYHLSSIIYNTQYVAKRVFADPHLLEALNAIVHPAVGLDIMKRQPDFVESAILYESGLDILCDRVIVIDAPEDIRIVVHPQSIIHSMVEFEDGAVLAQMGHPDMREPIQFALSFPDRLTLNNRKLDFSAIGSLTFEEPDFEKFPCLGLAFEAIRRGGNLPCAMNAANEAAVAAYLHEKIAFYDIPRIISEIMGRTAFIEKPSLEDILQTNKEAFDRANLLIDNK